MSDTLPVWPCTRSDHVERVHWHYGPGGRNDSTVFPHWDPVYVDEKHLYAREPRDYLPASEEALMSGDF
jgi:hypothetical protein